jgi:putative mRNA 3-end processing factor
MKRASDNDKMKPTDLLMLTPQGLYCPKGGFHLDPMRPVDKALITHAHSDHARAGHGSVLATEETLDLMRIRYGENFCQSEQVAVMGKPLVIGDVRVTFHPAGHVLGSAQILIEAAGLRLVLSGDYKRQEDATCAPFEVIPCDIFITEATFGLPVFSHPPIATEAQKLLQSLALFPDRAHLVGAYSLGKAQRVMRALHDAGHDRPIHLHGAMEKITGYYQERQIRLGETARVAGTSKADLKGAIVLCPPSSLNDLWSRRFPDPVTAFASGWMRTRARARQRGVELPLVVSDHADWADLCRTIGETGASEIWVTHGQEDALVHWCTSKGLSAKPLNMIGYGDEGEAVPDAAIEG